MKTKIVSSGLLLAGGATLAANASAQSVTMESVNSSGLWGALSETSSPYARADGLSADGRFMVYDSAANNVVPGDSIGGTNDVFVRDRQNGSVICASVAPSGVPANGDSSDGSITVDGRFVVFDSDASNIVAGDTNAHRDVFVRDLVLGVSERISVSSAGTQANQDSELAAISDDGRFVYFSSIATNLVAGDTAFTNDVFVRDRQLGVTELVTISTSGGPSNGSGGNVRCSPDGRFACFQHGATNLVPNDLNGKFDIFVRDRVAGATELISISTAGVQANDDCWLATISADGRYVAYESTASNLVLGDTNGKSDVFLRDRTLQTTTLVSVSSSGVQGAADSTGAWISADGRFVGFASYSGNLVFPDNNGTWDIFLRDLQNGTTRRISDNAFGAEANGQSYDPIVSSDGRYVFFTSHATNLVVLDNAFDDDAFLADTALVCPPISTYCTAKTNSSGCTPAIDAVGAPHVSGPDSFFLTAYHAIPSKSGVMFWGTTAAAIPFGGGTLCVHPPLVRTFVQSAGDLPTPSDCNGTYSFAFRQSYMAIHGLASGQTVYAQFWSRDPGFAPPNNIGLTNAIRFTLCD